MVLDQKWSWARSNSESKMSAPALRAAQEADTVLATALAKTKLLTAVKKLEVLSELEFEHEHDECEQALLASVENAEKMAAGERGDRVKFAAAAKLVKQRIPPSTHIPPRQGVDWECWLYCVLISGSRT